MSWEDKPAFFFFLLPPTVIPPGSGSGPKINVSTRVRLPTYLSAHPQVHGILYTDVIYRWALCIVRPDPEWHNAEFYYWLRNAKHETYRPATNDAI